MLLAGKVALVTGAAQGIGQACAVRLAKEGAKIALCDVNEKAGQQVARGIEAKGGKALFVRCDVSKAGDIESALAAALKAFRRIDVLVNNAGVVDDAPFLDLPIEELDRVLGINLRGAFLMAPVVLDLLRRKGLTLAVAETVTGGLLSARLSAVDWAMETFRGGQVAPDTGGGTAEQRALSAAASVRAKLGAGVGSAAVAADASEGFAPGTVFLAVDVQGAQRTEMVMLTPDRRRTREFSVISLLNLLRRVLTS